MIKGTGHEHQFVIPVEWKLDHDSAMGGYAWNNRGYVTKLRCVCGAETTREDNA